MPGDTVPILTNRCRSLSCTIQSSKRLREVAADGEAPGDEDVCLAREVQESMNSPFLQAAQAPAMVPAATRRVLNLRWLVGTILLLVVLVPAVYWWHSRQMQRVADAMRQEAELQETKGDYAQAARYLHRCLLLETDESARRELTIRLARTYDRSVPPGGDRATVINWYYRATGAAPEDSSLQERLAELFLETNQYVLADEQAAALLLRVPGHSGAQRIGTLARYGQLRRGRPVDARRVLRDLQDINRRLPGDVLVAEALVYAYRETPAGTEASDSTQRADAVMEALVRNAPDQFQSYLARHEYQSRYHAQSSLSDLAHALELAPNEPKVLLAAGEQAQRDGQWEQALERFQSLVRLQPNDFRSQLGLGETQYRLGNVAEAIQTWRGAIAHVRRGQASLRVRLADALIEQRDLDEAQTELAALEEAIRYLASSGDEVQRDWLVAARDLLQGKLLIARENYREAVPLLQRVATTAKSDQGQLPEASPRYQAWTLLGQCQLQLQEWQEAAASFQRALQVVPNSVTARVWAAQAWSMIGRDEEAIGLCQQIVARPGTPPSVWLLLSQLQLRTQLRRSPHLRDWQELEAVLDQAAVALPDQWELPLIRANLLLARDGMAGAGKAVQILVAEESRHPNSVPLWSNLVFLYERMRLPGEADRALQRLQTLVPNSAQTIAWKGALLAVRGDHQGAEKLLDDPAVQSLKDEEGWIDRARLFAASQQGDLDYFRKTLQQVVAHRPQSAELVAQLADLDLAQEDWSDLQERIAQLKATEGADGLWWRLFEARRLLAATGPNDRATAMAQAAALHDEIRRLRSWWPGAELLRAILAEEQGRNLEAVDAYMAAERGGFQQPFVYQSLVKLLYRLGRFEEADAWLAQLQRQSPLDARMMDLAWSSAAQRDQSELALQLARENVEHHPDEAAAHVWLAQMLWLSQQPQAAMDSVRRAEALEPRDVAVWSGILTFYLRSGDTDGVVRSLQRIVDQPLVAPALRHSIAAQTYQRLGRRDEAQAAYDDALAADPADSALKVRYAAFLQPLEPQKAENVLRDLLAIQPDYHPARQLLATWLHWKVDPSSQVEARELLQADSSDQQQQASDRRLEAMLLLRRGGEADLQTARDLLEKLVADPQNSSDEDRLLLAHLYEQSDDIPAAQEQLRTLATQPQATARSLASYVDFLLRHGQVNEAESQWLILEKQAGGTLSTVTLRSRILAASGRQDQIEPYLEAFAKQQLATVREPSQRQALLQQVGELFLAVGRNEAAERWFRRLTSEFPERREMLTHYWQSRQQHQEAIQFALEGMQQTPTPAAAALLARVLTFAPDESLGASPQISTQAESMWAEILTKHPDDADLLFSLSNLRLKQNRTDEAIRLLRQLTTSHPTHVTGWNNLAALLSEDTQQLAEALTCADRAIVAAGRPIGNLLDTKALVLLQMGEPTQAANLLLQAIALPDPPDPRFAFHLAVAQWRLGNHDQAKQAWRQAQQLGLEQTYLTGFERALMIEIAQRLKEQGT